MAASRGRNRGGGWGGRQRRHQPCRHLQSTCAQSLGPSTRKHKTDPTERHVYKTLAAAGNPAVVKTGQTDWKRLESWLAAVRRPGRKGESW